MVALEEPDKGYAWVVLFSACIINMILSGMARMIGLLYVGLIDAYGITREQASLPFTVRNAVRYLAGPLAGVLGQTYGIRAVSFCGGLIAAVGSILCFFAPSVTWIVIFWGIIHGLGFALANTLFQVVVNQYFEKHRASASGIVLSGACVAAFIFPIMIESILDEYGVFSCFLLLGGLFLHVLPPSMLLKTPPWVEFPEAYAAKREQLLKLQISKKCNKEKPFSISSQQMEPETKPFFYPSQNKELNFQPETKYSRQNAVCILYKPLDIDKILHRKEVTKFQDGTINPVFIPDSENNPIHHVEQKGTQKAPQPAPSEKEVGFFRNLQKIPELYRNPIYCLINISVAAYFSVLLPVFTVIVDYTRDKGIPRDCEKFLIYSLTSGDLLGRLAFGWVTDRKYIGFPNFMTISFFLQGIFTALLPLSKSLAVNVVVLALYGVTAGIVFTHIPVLVHKYVDKDNQSIAIGCVGLLSSVGTFGIPPLIGYFRDHIGSYDGLFYIISSFSIVTAGLWMLVSLYQNKQEKKFFVK